MKDESHNLLGDIQHLLDLGNGKDVTSLKSITVQLDTGGVLAIVGYEDVGDDLRITVSNIDPLELQ